MQIIRGAMVKLLLWVRVRVSVLVLGLGLGMGSVVTVRDFAFPVGCDRFLTPNFI